MRNIFLILMLFPTSISQAGDMVGRGGDVLVCTSSDANSLCGTYSFDYVAGFSEFGNSWPQVAISDVQTSLQRIAGLLFKNDHQLGERFQSFLLHLNGQGSQRRWLDTALVMRGLVFDESTLSLIPSNCLTRDPNLNVVTLRYAVFRSMGSRNEIIYEVNRSVMAELGGQQSYIFVHEWLWDLVDSGEANRRLNYFLHSTLVENLTPDEFKTEWHRILRL